MTYSSPHRLSNKFKYLKSVPMLMEHKMPKWLKLTRNQMEHRRLMAGEDLSIGMKHADVARKYGVNRSNVSRWAKILKKEGEGRLQFSKFRFTVLRLNPKILAIPSMSLPV